MLRKRKSPKRILIRLLVILAVIAAAVFALLPFVAATVKVTNGAMTPTIEIGDTVAVNRIAYLLFKPNKGDVVQFSIKNASGEDNVYLRRVIALPGETVQIMDGVVYINGVPKEEPYVSGLTEYGGIASSRLTLNDDEYFVMADNRTNNFDSRDSTVGPISSGDIVGKVWLIVNPFDHFGKVE